MRFTLRSLVATAVLFSSFACVQSPPSDGPAAPTEQWVGVWATSPEPVVIGMPDETPPTGFQDQTVRSSIRLTVKASPIRLRISNHYGIRPLVVGEAAVAVRAEGAQINEAHKAKLTVGGASTFSVPTGAIVITDPIDISQWPNADLVVDLYLPKETGTPTYHWQALETSYVSTAGNFAGSANFPVSQTTTYRFYVVGVDAWTQNHSAIVALGDSITDGSGSTIDAHGRWTDHLAARLDGASRSVLNHGIGGGRLLHKDIGTGAAARFDRDVLAQPGVKYVVVAIGINDIGMPMFGRPEEQVTSEEIILGYRQLIIRGRDHGLKVYGATMTPIGGSFFDIPENEQKREQVNAWMRETAGTPEGFDAVIDFDAVLRNPEQKNQIRAEFDSGDRLHPNDAGYKAMGDSIDLGLF